MANDTSQLLGIQLPRRPNSIQPAGRRLARETEEFSFDLADEPADRFIGRTIDNQVQLAKLKSRDEHCYTYVGWSFDKDVYSLHDVMMFTVVGVPEDQRKRIRHKCKRFKRKKSCIKVVKEDENETEFLIMLPKPVSHFMSGNTFYLLDIDEAIAVEISEPGGISRESTTQSTTEVKLPGSSFSSPSVLPLQQTADHTQVSQSLFPLSRTDHDGEQPSECPIPETTSSNPPGLAQENSVLRIGHARSLTNHSDVLTNALEPPQSLSSPNAEVPEFGASPTSSVSHQLWHVNCACHTAWPSQSQECTLYSKEPPPGALFRMIRLTRRRCSRCGYPHSPLEGDRSPKCKHPLKCEYPLECELYWFSPENNKDHKQQFSALSYCWGTATVKRKITIDGHVVGVTENLHEALISLRHASSDVNLWVDAICINQNDFADKNFQVHQMSNIYQAATKVIAWLGPSSPTSDLALKYLKDRLHVNSDMLSTAESPPSLTGDIKATLDRLSASDYWTKARIKARSTECLVTNIVAELASLWSLPYWSRVWVVQELAAVQKARHKCTLRWGGRGVPFKSFVAFMGIVRTKALPADRQGVTIACNRLIRLSNPTTSMDFLETLWESALLHSSDPLDRIYGIRYISPEFYRVNLPADYSLPFPDLYRKVMIQYIRRERSLDMLSCFRPLVQASHAPAEFESWLPDLRRRNSGLLPFNYNCAAGRPSQARIEGGVLYAWGSETGSVVENVKGPYLLGRSKRGITSPSLRDLQGLVLPILKAQQAEGRGEDYMSRFMSMVSGDRQYRMEDHHPYDDQLHLGPTQVWNARISFEDGSLTDEEEAQKNKRQFSAIFARVLKRCFFTTRDGRAGVGPADMEKDDAVVVLDGCRLCIILRACSGGFYSFVGPAYVDGVMGGEYVLCGKGDNVRNVEFAII